MLRLSRMKLVGNALRFVSVITMYREGTMTARDETSASIVVNENSTPTISSSQENSVA